MKKKLMILGLTSAAVFSTCAFLALGAKSFIPAVSEEEYKTITLDQNNNCCKGLEENEEFVLTNTLGGQGGTFSYECGTHSQNIEFGYVNTYHTYATRDTESEADFAIKFTFNIKGLRSIGIEPYGISGFNRTVYDYQGEILSSQDYGDEGSTRQFMSSEKACKVVFTMYSSPEANAIFIMKFQATYFVSKCLELCQ